MSEGINFKSDGTIEVTFDDLKYVLPRPTVAQYRQYEGALSEMRQTISDIGAEISDLRQQLKDSSGDVSKLLRTATAEINTPLYVLTAPILEDMFSEMAKRALPDRDEWPAWLGTNPSIVTQILDHWRTVPKVSGVPSPN